MPSGHACFSCLRQSSALRLTAASNPSSSISQSHFSLLPALPTTRAPWIFAICPAIEPTEPAAADTKNVSPSWGLPIRSTPYQAVSPLIPSSPTSISGGTFSSFGTRVNGIPLSPATT